jgi:hypothetical protein
VPSHVNKNPALFPLRPCVLTDSNQISFRLTLVLYFLHSFEMDTEITQYRFFLGMLIVAQLANKFPICMVYHHVQKSRYWTHFLPSHPGPRVLGPASDPLFRVRVPCSTSTRTVKRTTLYALVLICCRHHAVHTHYICTAADGVSTKRF